MLLKWALPLEVPAASGGHTLSKVIGPDLVNHELCVEIASMQKHDWDDFGSFEVDQRGVL